MSHQVRLLTSKSGSSQTRLPHWMDAINDFLGISGNQWNNTGPTGRFDQAVPFDGNLNGGSARQPG